MHKLYILAIALLAILLLAPFTSPTPFFSEQKPEPHKPFRILIVPGHEPETGGAVYLDRKERDLVVEIGRRLGELLVADSRFEAVMTRDANGFDPLFSLYFENADKIMDWQYQKKVEAIAKVDSGELVEVKGVEHNSASKEAATYLYGINKWSDENGVDFIVHLHINDDTRKNRKIPGKYSGFAIYIPEKQFSNSVESRGFAEEVKKSLEKSYKPSTLKAEEGTVLEAQELIAMGRYGTLDVPAILIEYGYIYEPIFGKEKFDETSTNMAEKTYQAIVSYLFPEEQL